jgi:uncharacterized metal-binding protein YceD (DUF177 family)
VSGQDCLWPVIVRLGDVVRFTEANPLSRRLVADESVRRAVAKALELVRLEQLEADLDVSGWFDGVRIHGRWRADIVQTCGVSLEDFPSALTGEFTVRAVPESSNHAVAPEAEIEIDIDSDDPPDVLGSDTIDLGGYVVEHLALEIDPFPRKPGAVFEPPEAEPESSPFAVLLKLKDPNPKA